MRKKKNFFPLLGLKEKAFLMIQRFEQWNFLKRNNRTRSAKFPKNLYNSSGKRKAKCKLNFPFFPSKKKK